jgi:magnesium transporter
MQMRHQLGQARVAVNDAVDVLENLDADTKTRIVDLLDDDAEKDVKLILSYEDDEIGSKMTTNFIVIGKNLNIRQATHELIRQAGENDNISTIYVVDENEQYYGAIDLKDLIVARDYQDLDDLISTSYPYVGAHEKISECIERLKDYAEDSIPVLSEEGKILGVITAYDIVEAVDEEMGEDYAKLAGLTAEEDLEETTFQSMKKRLPWLIILLFLGMVVSSVVGIFETVVAVIPIVMCFQSLILDMAGNVGTQSLAVTIRVLMDENLNRKDKFGLILKEMRIGFANGLFLGIMAFVFIGLYVCFIKGNALSYSFLISGCVGVSLMLAMVISSLVGTTIPLLFHKIKVDPAVASGPLITTVNDLVAVVTYYGLVWLFMIELLKI